MFKLPEQCKVNRFIPKNTFYQRVSLGTNVKNEFVTFINKITWLYKLAPTTLGATASDEVEEIQIFHIELKEKVVPKKALQIITKAIPYPILFYLTWNDEFLYAINYEKLYSSKWNEVLKFNFQGQSLAYIYNQIVKTVLGEKDKTKNVQEVVIEFDLIETLNKQVDLLEKRISKEKQFNKKVELNRQLQIIKKDLKELKK